jgi:hypothetical protein
MGRAGARRSCAPLADASQPQPALTAAATPRRPAPRTRAPPRPGHQSAFAVLERERAQLVALHANAGETLELGRPYYLLPT